MGLPYFQWCGNRNPRCWVRPAPEQLPAAAGAEVPQHLCRLLLLLMHGAGDGHEVQRRASFPWCASACDGAVISEHTLFETNAPTRPVR